jgi:ABC-2 type transport system permease protein
MSQPAEPQRSGAPHELGVIHDIGYRHYDGPRLGRGYLLRSLYIESLRGAYGLGRSAKSKVMPDLILVIMVFPAAIVAVVASVTSQTELPISYAQYISALGIAIAVFVASQAPASVSRDLRFRVMPLYFSRPLSRNDYVLAKYAAMTTAVFILILIPVLVLYVGALLAKMPFWVNTRGVLSGIAGALILAALLSAIGLLIASITPKRGFGVAAVIGVLIVLGLVGNNLRTLASDNNNDTLAGYLSGIDPFSLVNVVEYRLLGAKFDTITAPPGTTGGLVFAVVIVAVIAACYGALLLRYRKVSAS